MSGVSTEAYLPPGQIRTFTAPPLPAGSRSGRLLLSGDDVEFDNTAYFVAPEAEDVSVAYLGQASTNDPTTLLYYLQRVFQPTARRQVHFVSAESLPRAGFAVVPGKLAPEQAASVREWLASGKTGLMVLTSAEAGPTLAALLGVPEVQVTEVAGDYALLGKIDFKHPLFAPFDDPRFSDFSRIHFWKHRRWEIPSAVSGRVLAQFDDDSPALVQVPIGKGQLVVLGSGWSRRTANWPYPASFRR